MAVSIARASSSLPVVPRVVEQEDMVRPGRCPARTGGYALSAFFLAFGVVFLAELGDKSQLMALALAARYRAITVLIAVSLATLLVHAGSVLLGSVFALALPTNVIQIVAGVAFFGFAAWTIRGDSLGEGDESRTQRTGGWAILTIGAAFFLAELGDKTMLATVTLATTEEPWGTWLGSTAGMVAADAIAIALGAFLGKRLPERAIKLFAAAAFVVFGVLLIAEGAHLP
ncbi:MAG: TMEM165/GDT1 family protein [Candidatus Limnocylindrales bacterium]